METAGEYKVVYKKSKLGWIPKDWEEVKLEEIISKFVVPMRDKPKEFSGEIPWCRIEDFEGKYLYGSKSRQAVSEQVVKEMNLKVYPEGTLLVSCSANLGKCAIVGKPLITNQTFIGLVPIVKIVDTELLYYVMISSAGRLNRLSTGTTISYLSRQEFEKFNITLPKSLPEQQKIGSILSIWDKAIDKLSLLIAAKEQRKKGLMQLFLTGKKRFAGFTEEWKEVKLGQVTKSFSGGTPNSTKTEYYDGSIPFIGSGELNQGLVKKTNKHITEEGLKNSSAKIVEPQTLLIAMYGATAGVCAITEISGAINQAVLAVMPNSHIDKKFLYYGLVQQMPNVVFRMVQGGQPNLSGSILKSVKISFPEISEQKKIASTLSTADKEIELLKQGLNNLQWQKKGLMQKLLTGEVRVKIEKK